MRSRRCFNPLSFAPVASIDGVNMLRLDVLSTSSSSGSESGGSASAPEDVEPEVQGVEQTPEDVEPEVQAVEQTPAVQSLDELRADAQDSEAEIDAECKWFDVRYDAPDAAEERDLAGQNVLRGQAALK